MTPSFDSPSDRDGVVIRDHVERRTYTLSTSGGVDPDPIDPDSLGFPVDAAVSVTTDTVVLPTFVGAFVRDADGAMRLEVSNDTSARLPDGEYGIELCAPMKLYLGVEGPVEVLATPERIRFEFAPGTEVRIGARSHHERPPGTVTTTDDPEDVLAAVSTLGTALKTTSPERSFPTLRGHPPLVERGDDLRVPDDLDVPDTGVRIELPPERRYAYVAAPLALYLGADLVAANAPRIVTDEGFEHSLDGRRGFEGEVKRVLKQTFLLDCVTRTEGYYPVDLHERQGVEPLVDLDFADLYDRSLAERLQAHLSVPYEVVEEFVPTWKLTAHVEPTPEHVAALPFLADDLAVVRTPRTREVTAQSSSLPVGEFARDGDFTRSTADSSGKLPVVEPEPTDSIEQAWLGDSAPIDASKATPTAFRNRLDHDEPDGDIDIVVVCNDTAMGEERDLAAEVYGSREELPFDVTVRRDLTARELRGVLADDAAFLHYIGHIDEEGFECADGHLDATTLESVGVEAFVLNACQSYEQGMALVEAGSVGGVVTLDDVINSGAVRVGKTMIRLLNRGFPLRAALSIAKGRSLVGDSYIVVGDGNVEVSQTKSKVALLFEIETNGDGFELTPRSYPSNSIGMGSFVTPQIEDNCQSYLASGTLDTFRMSAEELQQIFFMENLPAKIDGKFSWSNDVDLEQL
ncbi:caspase family protein [Halorussus marinus]|uniref:caspase family protein n=1 Tax=Halorussus marinus TaxID=2505976 RepID=UPI0010928ED1|nr:caspase family protein [Halorussus marinus]